MSMNTAQIDVGNADRLFGLVWREAGVASRIRARHFGWPTARSEVIPVPRVKGLGIRPLHLRILLGRGVGDLKSPNHALGDANDVAIAAGCRAHAKEIRTYVMARAEVA